MSQQVERVLHQEVALRLGIAERSGALKAVWHSPPNGLWIPARTPTERALVARLIKQMKDRGQLQPGVPDFCFAWPTGSGFVEIKRPGTRTLLGKLPKGTLSDKQVEFQEKCVALGINHVVCTSWAEVESALKQWGILG